MAAAKSEEMVGAILKKDAADGEKAMKRFEWTFPPLYPVFSVKAGVNHMLL